MTKQSNDGVAASDPPADVHDGPRPSYRVLRPQHLRDVNEVAVLRHLIAVGPQSRLEIANALGLTQGPITRIVGRLIERGLVCESGDRAPAAGRGRPRVPVQIVAEAGVVIGAHIGLQRLTIGAAGMDGKVLTSARLAHDGTWPGTQQQIVDFVARIGQHRRAPLQGIGVIVGGRVNSERGLLATHEPLDWHDVPLRDDLEGHLHRQVFVESSARAHAQADVLFGTTGDVQNFLHVFIGNVIEVASVVDGRVRPGRDGVAGDVSSWIIGDDHGQATTARAALGDQHALQQARALGVIGPEDYVEQLVAVAETPEGAVARGIFLDRAAKAGPLLAQLDALLAPELIVISGGVVAVDGTLEAATAALQRSRKGVRPPKLRMARDGSSPLVSAAAAVVLERTLLNAV